MNDYSSHIAQEYLPLLLATSGLDGLRSKRFGRLSDSRVIGETHLPLADRLGTEAGLRAVVDAASSWSVLAKLMAWTDLRKLGIQPSASEGKIVRGAVLRVHMEHLGYDLLAAYEDGAARYINHADAVIVSEGDQTAARLVREFLLQCEPLLNMNGLGLPAPPSELPEVLWVLTYAGNALINEHNTRGATFDKAFSAATTLMQYLTGLVR